MMKLFSFGPESVVVFRRARIFRRGTLHRKKNVSFGQVRLRQVSLGQIRIGQVPVFFDGELSHGKKSQSRFQMNKRVRGNELGARELGAMIITIDNKRTKKNARMRVAQESPSPSLLHASLHTDKSRLNLINPKQIWIVNTLFRQIQHRAEFRSVLNLSEKGIYNPNLFWINKIQTRFVCVQRGMQQ